ncbi:hypothetical protein OCU04_002248 [Sclerotinia nivalis]|uniref:BTB domain-containing protein n=1 Tax=Sclerotinia nivalis TaxID=352851 RepID=A0A9X0DQH4_9HELO|nr:hypothetical protein OCU04_002248 [Sclerotinia nivalis]
MIAEGENAESCVSIGDERGALAEAKRNRDIAEQKRADAVSLKRSRGETPDFIEITGTETVDIYVGPEKKLFRIHRGILCDKVPYFQKMFSSGFVEALEGKVFFPEDSPQSFDLFYGWVYLGTLPTFNCVDGGGESGFNWNPLLLYFLADKLCLVELMDKSSDIYFEGLAKSGRIPKTEWVEKVYELTPMGSPLRKFMCHSMYYVFSTLRSERIEATWTTDGVAMVMKSHPDFAIDFLNLLRSNPVGIAAKDPTKLPKCDFHCHGKDEPCTQKPKILP